HQRAQNPRQSQAPQRIRAGYSLFPRQNKTLGKNGAPPLHSGTPPQRFRPEPPPQLSLAGIRRKSHERRPRQHLRRHIQHLLGLSTRPRSHWHQRARPPYGPRGNGAERRRAESRPIPLAGNVAENLSGRTANPSARHFRLHAIPQQRSRLGGRLDRPARRQQGSFPRRRRIHRLAGKKRSRPAPETLHRLRWPRRRHHPRPSRPLFRKDPHGLHSLRFPPRRRFRGRKKVDSRPPHSLQRRLGYPPHQRFPQLQSPRRRGFQSAKPGLQAQRRRRPPSRKTFRQFPEG